MKRCTKCQEQKPLHGFSPATRAKDGHNSWCRACCSARERERRLADPERARKLDKKHYEAKKQTPGFLEAKRLSSRARSAAGERAGEWHRQRFGKDLEPYIQALLQDPCSYCGGVSTTIDHIVPVADGGSDDWENLTPACFSCNRRKWDRSLLLFLAHRNGCYEYRRDVAA